MTRPRYATRRRMFGRREPVVLLADDRVVGAFVAAIGRLLWRYRSELAPLWLALLAEVGAAVLHARYPGAWAPILAASTAGATVLALCGDRCGLPRRVERAYGAVVAAATPSSAASQGPGSPVS